MADDYAGDITTTGVLPLNTFVTGEIEVLGDEDWFAIQLEAGTLYYFEIVGNALPPFDLAYSYFKIYDDAGQQIATASGFQSNESAQGDIYLAPESGEYFISAQSRQFATAAGPQTGTYRLLAVELVPEVAGFDDDYSNDGRSTATAMTPGAAVYSELSGSGDRDWYAFAVEEGKVYYAELDLRAFVSSVVNRGGRNAALDLVDAGGTGIRESTRLDPEGGRAGLTIAVDADTDTTLYAVARIGDSFYDGIYSFTLRELPTLFFTAAADWLSLPPDVPTGLLDIRGGAGSDTMSFAGLAQGVEVNLATGLARASGVVGAAPFSLIMDSIEAVTGTSRGDTVWGSNAAERVRGLGGTDTMNGSSGADRLDGGAGRDTVDYSGASAGVSASLLRDRGWGGDAAGDRFDGIEALTGSRFGDSLWGDHGANRLDGGHGDDTLTGNGGDDYILAGLGTDVIVFSGNRADYTVTRAGFRTVVDHGGGTSADGTDTLAHAEILRFADDDMIL